MPDRQVRQLSVLLQAAGLPVRVDDYDTIWVERGPLSCFITKRPYYCDRGRWLVHAESTEPHMLCIDHADGFPRYFFFDDCLVREFEHWFSVRYNHYDVKASRQRASKDLECHQAPE